MAQPKKPRQKQIKLKDITKKYNQMNTYKTHILNEKKNEVIKYLEVFDENRIQELMKEANEDSIYVTENGLDVFKDEDGNEDIKFLKYIYFLIIKHMTELKSEITGTFEEKAYLFNQIEATGLFHELIENAFLPEEISKVLERVASFALLSRKLIDIEAETRLKALETVQHPVVKKKLQEGKFDAKV